MCEALDQPLISQFSKIARGVHLINLQLASTYRESTKERTTRKWTGKEAEKQRSKAVWWKSKETKQGKKWKRPGSTYSTARTVLQFCLRGVSWVYIFHFVFSHLCNADLQNSLVFLFCIAMTWSVDKLQYKQSKHKLSNILQSISHIQ